jgi:hypothetical protein
MVVQELAPALKIRVKRGVKADMLAVRPAKSCSPQRRGRHQLEESSIEDTVVTINDIFSQCASTELASSAMQPRQVLLLDDVEFARAWHAFTAWLKDETSAHRCVQVPGLGVLSFRLFPLGIRIPTFELSEAYLDHHGLSQEQNFSSRQVHNAGEGPPVRFDAKLIADAAGLSAACTAFAIDSVLHSIGVAAATGCTLWIDFRVGVLAGRRRFLKFSYVQGVDSLRLMSVPHRPTTSCAPPTNSSSSCSSGNHKGIVGAGGAFAASGKYYIPGTARAVQAEAKVEQRSAAAAHAAVVAAELSAKRTEPVCGEAELPVESSTLLRAWQPGKGSHSRSPLSAILSHSSSAAVQPQQQQQQQSTDTVQQQLPAVAAARVEAAAAYVACGASPLQDDYPPLIDVHARLAAAVLCCGNGSSRAAEVHGVEKIGRYFSPTAAALSLCHVTHNVIWSSDHGGDAGPPQNVHPFAAAVDKSSTTATDSITAAAAVAAAVAAAAAVQTTKCTSQKVDVSTTSDLQRQDRLHRRRPTTPAGAAAKRRTLLHSSIPVACSSSSCSSAECEGDAPLLSSEELDSMAAYLHYLQHDAVLQQSVLPLQDSWVKAVLSRALQPGRCGVTTAYTATSTATAASTDTAAAGAVDGSGAAALSASYSKGLATTAGTTGRTVPPATPWRASLTSLPPHLADCARGVLAAAQSTYELSIRRSILNYVLLCPQQG